MEQRSVISTPRAIGNYILEAELGRGASSQVWRGRHRMLREREVAVKILLSQDEESVTRFSREATVTAQLRHPNIVAVYDHGQSGNFMYTIMELVHEGALRQHMVKHRRLDLKHALAIFRQIGSALDFAHGRDIVHRDVAPGNILLETAEGRALLTDFGIARLTRQSQTTTHVIMGTPGFFSPEHAQSATAVTALSDLYGLGVVLYFMLSGHLPWAEAPTHPDYHFGPVLPLAHHNVDLPPEIDQIFQTLLAIDPKKRYPTAAAACEAIDRALQRAGVLLDHHSAVLALPAASVVRAINTAPNYQSAGLSETDVETVLGPDLVREPIERAHARAERLRDPLVLAQILDHWSNTGSFWEFRRPHLGRIINLHSVVSRNVYGYRLRVLLETRTAPTTITEPDRDAVDFKVQREVERWKIKLPQPLEFSDDPGRAEIIPGSERVLRCDRCAGEGQAVCSECKGTRRVMRTVALAAHAPADVHEQITVSRQQANGAAVAAQRPVEVKQTLIPCPACEGVGAVPCEHCEGVGRLVQRKVFEWKRSAYESAAHDDLPNLDEAALRRAVEPTEVYCERAGSLKREWSEIHALQTLLTNLEARIGPDTRVALAEVAVDLIPYTEVEWDLGRSDLAVEDAEPARQIDDHSYRLQIYGWDNRLQLPRAAYDPWRRFELFGLALSVIIVALYTFYIFIIR